jgi:membrane-bound lytic murein transglycosylase D
MAVFAGCSNTSPQKSELLPAPSKLQQSYKSPYLLASASSSFRYQDTIPARPNQSIIDADTLAADSTGDDDEKQIIELLERAREHYLVALQAQAEGDSLMSADEFEEAIKHLNEASYFPNIEGNTDFNELTRSVIEDYEKYIATIDSLGANTSIFALREKLNLDIEKIDITNIQIPPSLIPKTDVPLHINEYTKRTLAFFMGKGRVHMENWIYRSGKYFPTMSRIFQEEGLPPELMLLSLPESGLNPTARSWAKAVGLWQFMKATGAQYGLRSTYWYDERRDFEKATRAAARHMKDLYAEFNDWHLVFVAYNAGGGWVRRGIRRSGSTDYWEMRHRLPRETRNYVPQYIATALIIMRPEAFGFGDIKQADSLSFEKVTVDDCVDLAILAECAETDLETIRDLNPELTQWCTPPNYKGYQLRIPYGKSAVFAEKYSQIPDEKKFDFAIHTIRRGETLSKIAGRYKVTSAVLLEVNKLTKSKRLKVGSTLVIPVKSNSASAIVEAQKKKELADLQRYNRIKEEGRKIAAAGTVVTGANSPQRRKLRAQQTTYEPKGREKVMYKVQAGETIGHIAEWFNVRASHIRNWNNIPYGRHIYPGQRLAIWVPEEKFEQYKTLAAKTFSEKQKSFAQSSKKKPTPQRETRTSIGWVQHKVKKGETLEKIAAQYDVAIADLKSWNRLKTSRINAGELLEVFSPDQSEEPAEDVVVKKQPASQTSKRTATHVVKRGETLEHIAEQYNVTISDLKKWNDLKNSRIMVGQKLKIQS